jgi:hypothetical protein
VRWAVRAGDVLGWRSCAARVVGVRDRGGVAKLFDHEEASVAVDNALDPVLLVAGPNVVAVEVHQASGDSSDLSFDLELVGTVRSGT